MQSALERSAPAIGAAITLIVALAWCLPVLGYGAWPSLGAGLVCSALVFAALRLAIRRSRCVRAASWVSWSRPEG